jgi:hypothetical protein
MTILKQLIANAEKMAHLSLIEHKQEELMTMFHLVSPDNKGDIVIGTPWGNEREKLASVAEVKRRAHEMGAVAAMFCGEVWLHEVPAGVDITKLDPPSQQPNRIEAVLAIAIDNDGNMESGQWNIIRNRSDGAIIALVEHKTGIHNFAGRILDGMLPPKKG